MIKKLTCPICSKTHIQLYWAMPGYKLAKCLNCGTVWDYNPPENELLIYNESYFVNANPKGGYANYFEGMKINKKTFAERLRRIQKKYGQGKLLDVGCALGDCLVEAKKLGWRDPVGLEISNYAVEKARARNLNVIPGYLSDTTFPKESFTIVLYQDVLEHVKDPALELKRAFKIIKKGGVIFLVTPDVEGLWNKILGRLWYHYKPREHIMYFSPRSLSMALQKAGFTNIETRGTYHLLSLEYVLNRLSYYSPSVFNFILKLIRITSLKNLSFKAYTGEIEAWGEKL
jgi:2-polyprenyl-3-methyl-5-hydroxy-6-metoxy-1,4-benzoquinol methylase